MGADEVAPERQRGSRAVEAGISGFRGSVGFWGEAKTARWVSRNSERCGMPPDGNMAHSIIGKRIAYRYSAIVLRGGQIFGKNFAATGFFGGCQNLGIVELDAVKCLDFNGPSYNIRCHRFTGNGGKGIEKCEQSSHIGNPFANEDG